MEKKSVGNVDDIKKTKKQLPQKNLETLHQTEKSMLPLSNKSLYMFYVFSKTPTVSWLLHNSFTLLWIISFVLISFEKCHWSILELLLKVFVYFMYTLVLLNNPSNVRWQ